MNKHFLKEVLRVFVFAFVGAFVPLLQGIWLAPDWNAQKAALLAALVAGIAAATKAVTDFLTKGVEPSPQTGILPPSVKQ